jgi:hypothetical protein
MIIGKNGKDMHMINWDERSVTLQVQEPESMNSSRALRGTRVGVLLIASLLFGLALCANPFQLVAQAPPQPAPRAQKDSAPQGTAPTKDAQREVWRKAMVGIPLPRKGCFKASYPNKEWQEVPCSKAPLLTFPPQSRGGGPQHGGPGGPQTVGGGVDWAAQSASTITSTEGLFMSATGVTSEAGAGTANSFSLQLNTNFFTNTTTTALCAGATNPAACQGWEQFVFSNNTPPPFCSGCAYIQYWLFPYSGAACPTGWMSSSGGCVTNSTAVSGPSVPIANLTLMTLTGQASGGTDTIIVDTGGGGAPLNATRTDTTLDLEASWNVSEFNIFGNGGGSQAVFNAGSTVDVETSITDGTTNAPACVLQSNTAETNNLTLANVTGSSSQVCCAYSGSPRIEFMETNAGHTATCGPTKLEGDPHITTVDGSHYDFQGAGEFISLRGSDGAEIQTRQIPVATTALGTDAHDGLSTCVSLNTAVAARVGEHRVTYEPNLNGIPDPTGLQLRVDGALTALGPYGINLGNGGRVVQSLTGGNLEVDFPDGKALFVTPQFWTAYGKWYLNVDVASAGLVSTDGGGAALRGIAGPVPNGSWLPAMPNGASMGPMPATLVQRYDDLYHKFANAWRVTDKDSLFDYAPGMSTATFTDRNWPGEKAPCVVPDAKPVQPTSLEVAEAACRRVADANRRADCIFDVQTTGNIGFATTYLVTQRILKDSTTIRLTDDPEPSQLGESVTFTAFVAATGPEGIGHPIGTVQFAVDGMNMGAPVLLDAKGRATWQTTGLKVGKHQVTAGYLPGADSAFLPSTSVAQVHMVKRCRCDEEETKRK